MAAVDDATFTAIMAQEERRADPLRFWKPRSWAQRAFLSCWVEYRQLTEVYWHASNSGGKTEGLAALVVSLLQKREEVAGIALPTFEEAAIVGALLVHSYKQASLSSWQAIRKLLGRCEYHAANEVDGCPTILYVRQQGNLSDDRATWSRLLIFPRNGEVPDGLRLHFAGADEPPDEEMWRELRFRATSGLRFMRFIGATPKQKRFWRWLLEDYEKNCGKEPGREDDWRSTIHNARLRLQSSIYDNKALLPADIRRAEQDAASDPEKDARLLGDHVDATGENPWSAEVLARWRTLCTEPKMRKIMIQREKDIGGGKKLVEIACEVEVWDEPVSYDAYYIPLDPAKGTGGDPDGLHVWSIRRNRLVARVNASLGGYGLGTAAAIIARHYNNALVDPAVTGGYGETIFTALRAADYWNINRQQYWDRTTNQWASRLGFDEGGGFAGEIRGAIDMAIRTDGCEIPSLAVIETLTHCQYNENGLIVGESKYHDEDLVLAGVAQIVIPRIRDTLPAIEETQETLDFEEALAKDMGHRVEHYEIPEPVVIERW